MILFQHYHFITGGVKNQVQKRRKTAWFSHFRPLPLLILTATRRAFGSGFARPSALALRCCGASPDNPLRLAFGQGCARLSAWLRSAYSLRPAPGRAVSGGLRPPLAGPLASHSLSLGFGFCGMRGGCGSPGGPAARLGASLRPGFGPGPRGGSGRAFASGRLSAVPCPIANPSLRAGFAPRPSPGASSPPACIARSVPGRKAPFGPPSAALRGLAPLPGRGLCCFAGGSPPACFFLWWALRAVLFRAPPPGGAWWARAGLRPVPRLCAASGPPRARCGGVWFAAAAGFAGPGLRPVPAP